MEAWPLGNQQATRWLLGFDERLRRRATAWRYAVPSREMKGPPSVWTARSNYKRLTAKDQTFIGMDSHLPRQARARKGSEESGLAFLTLAALRLVRRATKLQAHFVRRCLV